jgi:putative ABC transport system permease protein
MFLRLLYESFRHQKRRKLLAMAALALGTAVVTAMVATATEIGDKMSRELRVYGANLIVYPAADDLDVQIGGAIIKPAAPDALLREEDLPKIKGIFWRNNVTGFAPFLPVPAEVAIAATTHKATLLGTYFSKEITFGKETFTVGVQQTHPWWKVVGAWPKAETEVLAGSSLAEKLRLKAGDTVSVNGRVLQVTGVLSASGDEDEMLIGELPLAQAMANAPGAVRSVQVSALTKPEDDFARRDPSTMSAEMRDKWYCSPYANSIAFQLREALPGANAEQIRRVAQSEGVVLSRIQGIMLLITLAALLAAVLTVSAAMNAAVLERRAEIGVMKAIGAGNPLVSGIFFSEAALLAIIGGGIGFLLGKVMAQQVGEVVFGTHINAGVVLLPFVLLAALLVAFAGSFTAIRRALRLDPAMVLRGDA